MKLSRAMVVAEQHRETTRPNAGTRSVGWMVPRCSVGISNVKVDARHNTSARRLPHAVSKAPLNGNLAPFLLLPL